jgi:ankyrin repeat protein
MIRLLLEHGADPSGALDDGATAVTMALSGRGARTLTRDSSMFEAVQLMLESGYDVNAVDDDGQTLLHRNVDRGEAFVRMLLAHGARADLRDASGRTALDIALGVGTPVPDTGAPGGRGGRGVGAAPMSGDDATIALLAAAAASGDDR